MSSLERTEIIISDLHVGAGQLDDCDAALEARLVEFLDGLVLRQTPVELVINGDFLDFAQAEPWRGLPFQGVSSDGTLLCFTEEQSLQKLNNIISSHRPIFRALRQLLESSTDHRLVILPGNHDADFFWPAVRGRFFEELCGLPSGPLTQQLKFWLERVYRPEHLPHVHIEHGHQHDPCNQFIIGDQFRWSEVQPPICVDKNGQKRLLECIGTRFMIQCMNELDFHYQFIDNIKPFSRFINLFVMSVLKYHYGPITALSAVHTALNFLQKTGRKRFPDLLSDEEALDIGGQVAHSLQARVAALSELRQSEIVAALRSQGFKMPVPLDMFVLEPTRALKLLDFLAGHPPVLALFDGAAVQHAGSDRDEEPDDGTGLLSLGLQGFVKAHNETRLLRLEAQKILSDPQVGLVVMGHTHDKIEGEYDRRYFNTGCWTRQARLEGLTTSRLWPMLRRNAEKDFPYELLYMEISAHSAQLRCFAREGTTA